MRAGMAPAGYSCRYRGDLAGGAGAMSGMPGNCPVLRVHGDYAPMEVGR
jgi:hypothetical protein